MKTICVVLLCFMYLTMSANANCCYPQTKVYKENKSTSTYSLINTNSWIQYPQLIINLELAEPRLVFVGYTISIGSSGDSHLVTRLRVDNVQETFYRAISGNTVYHTNSVSGYVSLSEGKHEIKVEYRTPGSFSVPTSDWITAQLQVVY